jgi:hypothetical protein
MLKPRAEINGEKKTKPKEPRVVNPRYQAQMRRVTETLGGEKQLDFVQKARSGKLKSGTAAYKKAEKAAQAEKSKKFAEFAGVKNKKSYSKKEQAAATKKTLDAMATFGTGDRGRRDKAFVKYVLREAPANAKKVFGEAGYKKIVAAATRTGKGAKGGGKKRKTDRRAVIGGTEVTTRTQSRSGKVTTRTDKMGEFKQGYARKGEPKGARVNQGKRQFDTSFRGEGAAPTGGRSTAKAPKAKTKKGEFQKTKATKAAPAKKEAAKTAPAKKEEAPKVKRTAEADRLLAQKAQRDKAKNAPAAKPAPAAPAPKPAAPKPAAPKPAAPAKKEAPKPAQKPATKMTAKELDTEYKQLQAKKGKTKDDNMRLNIITNQIIRNREAGEAAIREAVRKRKESKGGK